MPPNGKSEVQSYFIVGITKSAPERMPVGQRDGITFGLKPGEKVGRIGFQHCQIPGCQIIAQAFRQAG